MAKIAIQGGVDNYLGEQPQVQAPKKWKSAPNHPETELAYITKAEKNLLLKKDLHNSLNGKPNKGPSGIISLNGFGSTDSGQNRSGVDVSNTMDRGGDDGNDRFGSSSAGVAAARINAQQKELKKIREEKARQDLKKQLMGGQVNTYSTNYFVNANRFAKNKKNNLRKKLEQDFIRKTKDSNLEELGLIDSQGMSIGGFKIPSFLAGAASAYKIDPNTKYFDEDSIREIGSQLQYTPTLDPVTGKTTFGMTSSQTKTLGDLKEDIQMQDGKGYRPFDEYKDRNKITREGNDNILPQYAMLGGGAALGGEDAVQKEYDYRLSDGSQDVIYENYGTPGYRTTAAEGGIMGTRARRAMGGIMNRVDKRQQFFLGGIGKAIKGVVGGVVDATKKVLKSDVGKMALIYGATAGLGSLAGGGGFGSLFKAGTYNPANFLGKKGYLATLGKKALLKDGTGSFTDLGNYSLGKLGLLGLGGAALFGNKAAPNETSFSDRGGSLRNSQGQEGQQAIRDEIYDAYENKDPDKIASLQRYYGYKLPALNAVADLSLPSSLPYRNYAQGGRIGKAEGGLMDLGGMEKDYRAEGGFVPIGEYEKKDDVPARLSVNEFVFTADAVRGAGQGDIDKGAEIMENMMENLENGGTVSEESQGNKGAQQMFETSERLGAVI